MDVLKILLENGASLAAEDWAGQSPFYKAVEEGHFEVVKYLVEHYKDKIEINQQRKIDGKSVLHICCQNQFIAMLFYLIAHGADISLLDNVSLYQYCISFI